jgi:hypothetical protein
VCADGYTSNVPHEVIMIRMADDERTKHKCLWMVSCAGGIVAEMSAGETGRMEQWAGDIKSSNL